MKIFNSLLASMLLFPACLNAQGWPANYGGVMLQGFYWDSFVDTQWSNIESQADELSEFFDLVWVPQSGNCNTTYNVMGYTPVYYYDQNSSFGTESQLRSMISALGKRGVGVIADVVVNHRGSLGVGGSWVDFPAETHNGVTYQMGLADICRDDDGGATARLYNVTGAADTGEDWSGMRDLDHTSKNVQDNVIAYLRFLKDELGYAGFRYDMTKGYAAKYTGLYNSTVAPQFSVGEYWDGNATLLRNWVDGTMVDGKPQSATFDFATRYAIRDACNGGNWSKLSGIGLASYRDYRRYAVTFVENHDTQYRDASSPGDPVRSYVEAANAYILTMPGTPCVFLSHWKGYKNAIKQLVTVRKMAGITNQSATRVLNNSSSLFAVEVTGNKAGVIGVYGTGAYTAPAGYKLTASGNGYKVYVSGSAESPWVSAPSGTYDGAFSVTLSAISADASARIVYTTDGTEPTASSASLPDGGSVRITATTMLKAGLLSGGVVSNVITRHYAIEPFEAHKATVYVKDPGWSSLYLYAWANDAASTQLNGAWPGSRVTATCDINGERWYYQSFDVATSDYSFNVIFDQGSSSGQTVDIGPISEDKYYVISEGMTNGKYTVTDVTGNYSAISGVVAGDLASQGPVKVYTVGGQLLRVAPAGTSVANAVDGFGKGIYIVGGKKVVR